MPLTQRNREAARAAEYFGLQLLESRGGRLSPIAAIACVRGAKTSIRISSGCLDRGVRYTRWASPEDRQICRVADHDVAESLGFSPDSDAWYDAYFAAFREGRLRNFLCPLWGESSVDASQTS